MRSGGAGAEVRRRVDDAAAEVELPNAVHHDARGERIGGRSDPLGQALAALRGFGGQRRRRNVATTEGCQNTGAHLLAFTAALRGQEGAWRFAADVRQARRKGARREVLIHPYQLLLDLVEPLGLVLRKHAVDLGVRGLHFLLKLVGNFLLLGRLLIIRSLERRIHFGRHLRQCRVAQRLAMRIEQRHHLRAQLLQAERARILVQVVAAGVVVVEEDARLLVGHEDGLHAVVVALGNRVKLMVVAARAAHRQAQKDAAGGVGKVGEGFDAILPLLLVEHVAVGADGVEAGALLGLGLFRIDLVAGDGLADEAIIRLVVIEALDDVVAVAP